MSCLPARGACRTRCRAASQDAPRRQARRLPCPGSRWQGGGRSGPNGSGPARTLALPGAGCLQPRPSRHSVGPHLDALLVLPAGLRSILPLRHGLLNQPRLVARRGGVAALERTGANAPGRGQQHRHEPGAQEPREVIPRGKAALRGTTGELRTPNLQPRTSNLRFRPSALGLRPSDFGARPSHSAFRIPHLRGFSL